MPGEPRREPVRKAASAGETRVVLPALGAAMSTTEREGPSAAVIAESRGSTRSGSTRAGSARSAIDTDANRTADAGAAEAAVPAGILGEVLLMIVLLIIERRSRQNFGCDPWVS